MKNVFFALLAVILGSGLHTLSDMKLDELMQSQMIYTTPGSPAFHENQDFSAKQLPPLVRLHHGKDNRFFCSGTVISDDYILTAAHCLMKGVYFPSMTTEDINVVSMTLPNSAPVTVVAKANSLNQRADYALVRGDFRAFQKAKILHTPDMFGKLVGPGVVCGFPWGSTDICYSINSGLATWHEHLAASGRMYPGMSGGPVLDVGSRAIFAINTGIAEGAIILSPLIGLFETLEIEVVQ